MVCPGANAPEVVFNLNRQSAVDQGVTEQRRIARRDLIGGLFAQLAALFFFLRGVRDAGAPAPISGPRKPRLARGLRWCRGSGEVFITTAQGARLALNETATEVLSLCNGRRTVNQVGRELARRHPRAGDQVAVHAQETLATLSALGVLR